MNIQCFLWLAMWWQQQIWLLKIKVKLFYFTILIHSNFLTILTFKRFEHCFHGSFFLHCAVYAEQARPVYIISLQESSLKSSLLKTLVISFWGQAIYVQLDDTDAEGCRVAGQPRSSQGHFLCSTPYRARLRLSCWQSCSGSFCSHSPA